MSNILCKIPSLLTWATIASSAYRSSDTSSSIVIMALFITRGSTTSWKQILIDPLYSGFNKDEGI
jgi:hypothetical protein